MTPTHRLGRRFLAFALVACASGCGGGFATLEGSVTLDGTAVESGYVTFVPIEGTTGSGARAQIIQGRYSIDSTSATKPGLYRVEIFARRKTGKKIPMGSPAPPEQWPTRKSSPSPQATINNPPCARS